ncbi:MAG: hypothetical protein QOK24_899 [Verrucomicrobiota bacterium]|jgi:hypothetical protein
MVSPHRKHLVVCLLVALVSGHSLSAHQDTLIRLEGNTLIGLPAQYSPAELDLEALRLRIGRHAMVLSPLLKSFFRRQPYDLQIVSSWYHDNQDGSLPPYLSLHIKPKGRDYSYRIMLALDTLHVLDVSIALQGSEGPPETFTLQRLRIALSDFEKKQIEESIIDVP